MHDHSVKKDRSAAYGLLGLAVGYTVCKLPSSHVDFCSLTQSLALLLFIENLGLFHTSYFLFFFTKGFCRNTLGKWNETAFPSMVTWSLCAPVP